MCLLVQHQVAVGDGFEIDYARDLSRGGLFIDTRKRFVRGSTVHVQFSPTRDSRLVSAFCRVTHVSDKGMGAEFVALDADSQRLIDQCVVMAKAALSSSRAADAAQA